MPCKSRGLIDAVRSVQLLGGSIVVCSMSRVELRLVGRCQGRKAAGREGHRQSYGNKEEAGRQTLQDVRSKACSRRIKEDLRSALCSMLRSVVGEAEEEVSHVTQTTKARAGWR